MMPVSVLHMDFETYSEADLRQVGAYRYAMDPSTEVLVLCWALDDEPVQRWDVLGTPGAKAYSPPGRLLAALRSNVTVAAHNALFERAVWAYTLHKRHGWPPPPPLERWYCTAVNAAARYLPRSLDRATAALRLPHRKDPRGNALIKTFCMPQPKGKPRVLPEHDPGAFEELVDYCAADVEAERGLHAVLPPLTDWEQRMFRLNARVNDNGLPLDMPLIRNARQILAQLESSAAARVHELTEGIRPTQRDKLLAWLQENGATIADLKADSLRGLLSNESTVHISPAVREVLTLRLEASRVSTKKLAAMEAVACPDNRARGTLRCYGGHTGRESGQLVQPHNFPRGNLSLEVMSAVLRLLRDSDAATVEALIPAPIYVASQCMRGFIAAEEGAMLLVVDYAQIEARVLDWHAHNSEGLRRWISGKDPYKLMAMLIFGIAHIEDVAPEQRRVAKNAVLGAGFGMSASAFLTYCHSNGATDVDEELAGRAIGTYRQTNTPVVDYWYSVERHAAAAIANPGNVYQMNHVAFRTCPLGKVGRALCIDLPSGRSLWYPHARLQDTGFHGRQQIVFTSPDRAEQYTYGARLVENIVQATAGDFMFSGIERALAHGYRAVSTVHDEGVFEVAEADLRSGKVSLVELEKLLCTLPRWGAGCPISAKGFSTKFYRKD